jgi:hypothetical protein
MRKITLVSLLCGLVVPFASWFAQPALAHGGEPRLEISPGRASPGGVVDIRGVDFEFEEQISLALIGPDFEVAMGELTADSEGAFLQTVTLPVELKEGTYHFRAITDDHQIQSPAILVSGPAILNEGGGQGERGEDDGLLAPMPTSVPVGVAPNVSPEAAPPKPGTNRTTLALSLVAMTAVSAALIAGWRLWKRR